MMCFENILGSESTDVYCAQALHGAQLISVAVPFLVPSKSGLSKSGGKRR